MELSATIISNNISPRDGVITTVRFVLAGLFLLGGLSKFIDHEAATNVVALLLGYTPDGSILHSSGYSIPVIVVYVIAGLEILLSAWLILGRALTWGIRLSGLLITAFTAVLLYLLLNGTELDACGCFGALFESGGIEKSIIRNFAFLLLVAIGLMLNPGPSGNA